jgi:hypothetical protein
MGLILKDILYFSRFPLSAVCVLAGDGPRRVTLGEVPERLNGTDSKSVIRLITVSGVRIPPSPPS